MKLKTKQGPSFNELPLYLVVTKPEAKPAPNASACAPLCARSTLLREANSYCSGLQGWGTTTEAGTSVIKSETSPIEPLPLINRLGYFGSGRSYYNDIEEPKE